MGKIVKVALSAVVVAMSLNFVACDKGTISNKVSSILNLMLVLHIIKIN